MSSMPVVRPLYDPRGSSPIRDEKHLAWIRTLPCSISHCRRRSEACHTGGHGISQKAPDRRAIPLCPLHHKEYHRIGRRKFELSYELDIEGLIAKLNERPKVRVLGSRFVASLGGDEYDLGPLSITLAGAVAAAIAICRERPLNVRL